MIADYCSGNFGSISDGAGGSYNFEWLQDGSQWKGYLTLGNNAPPPPPPPPPTPPQQQVNNLGKFLTKSLSLGAKSAGVSGLYDRINLSGQSGDAWVGFFGNGRSDGNFNMSGAGFNAGADIIISKSFVGGLYAKMLNSDLKMDELKMEMSDIEFGVYFGIFNISDIINIKGSLGYASLDYQINKYENNHFSIDANRLSGGFDAEYVISKQSIYIKPFVGARLALFSADNSSYFYDNQYSQYISIAQRNFMRADILAGLGIESKGSKLIWRAKANIGLVPTEEPKLETTNGTDLTTEENGESFYAAISGGAEYPITNAISIFANIGADFGEGFGWTGGLGANYKF
jgi:hypothetical protein